jgi:hypothetical protein
LLLKVVPAGDSPPRCAAKRRRVSAGSEGSGAGSKQRSKAQIHAFVTYLFVCLFGCLFACTHLLRLLLDLDLFKVQASLEKFGEQLDKVFIMLSKEGWAVALSNAELKKLRGNLSRMDLQANKHELCVSTLQSITFLLGDVDKIMSLMTCHADNQRTSTCESYVELAKAFALALRVSQQSTHVCLTGHDCCEGFCRTTRCGTSPSILDLPLLLKVRG